MKWAIQAKEEEKNKSQTFSADGWTGNSKIFTNVVKKWARTPLSPESKTIRNKWAEWLRREEREGDKGAKAFCPGWRHQPGQNGSTNRDKRPWPPYPLPSPPARAIQLTCFMLFSAREREEFLLISSPHLWRSLIPCPSIGAKGLWLVFLFFLGLYSSFHALEIEKMCS